MLSNLDPCGPRRVRWRCEHDDQQRRSHRRHLRAGVRAGCRGLCRELPVARRHRRGDQCHGGGVDRGRPVGRPGVAGEALAARHDRQCVVVDQGRGGVGRTHARRSRSARPRRAGGDAIGPSSPRPANSRSRCATCSAIAAGSAAPANRSASTICPTGGRSPRRWPRASRGGSPAPQSGYHALTFGYLVGEVIRRITGRSVGTFVADEIAAPLGADVSIGLDTSSIERCATLSMDAPPPDSANAAMFAQLDPAVLAALTNPSMAAPAAADIGNAESWRRAEIPAANGHATARALATVYAVLAQGGDHAGTRLLSATAAERIREGQGRAVDLVLGVGNAGLPNEWALGVLLSGPEAIYGPNPRAFGHGGYGGSFGMADPEEQLSIGYVMNHMGNNLTRRSAAARAHRLGVRIPVTEHTRPPPHRAAALPRRRAGAGTCSSVRRSPGGRRSGVRGRFDPAVHRLARTRQRTGTRRRRFLVSRRRHGVSRHSSLPLVPSNGTPCSSSRRASCSREDTPSLA